MAVSIEGAVYLLDDQELFNGIYNATDHNYAGADHKITEVALVTEADGEVTILVTVDEKAETVPAPGPATVLVDQGKYKLDDGVFFTPIYNAIGHNYAEATHKITAAELVPGPDGLENKIRVTVASK